MTLLDVVLQDDHFKVGSIIVSRPGGKSRYCLIVASKKLVSSCRYTIIPLRLSKWRWIKEFQLWMIRRIFN